MLGLWEWGFLSYFYSKNSHNSEENGHMGKNFKLVLKPICKVFIKYQANAMFCSLCLRSGNAIFGGRRKRKKVGNPHI